jgi:hypothetical protein
MRLLLAIVLSSCAAGAPRPVEPAPAKDVDVALAGGANALWWDAATSTLYLTDSNTSALVTWTERGGLQSVAAVPAGTAGVSLGGIVRRPDGSTVIANFGFGTQGGLFVVGADRAITALTGLDPARRRVGLARAGAMLYSAYFVAAHDTQPTGGVATVAITGGAATETEIAGASTSAGFGKIVGVAATPTAVFVSDQSQKAIFKLAVPGYAVTRLADVPAADLLALLPDGDLLTGGGATITRITPAGQVRALALGSASRFEQVRGLAYDPAGKRLFIIDHSLTPGSPDQLHVRHLD